MNPHCGGSPVAFQILAQILAPFLGSALGSKLDLFLDYGFSYSFCSSLFATHLASPTAEPFASSSQKPPVVIACHRVNGGGRERFSFFTLVPQTFQLLGEGEAAGSHGAVRQQWGPAT